MDQIKHTKIFLKLDIHQVVQRIRMNPDSEGLTIFCAS